MSTPGREQLAKIVGKNIRHCRGTMPANQLGQITGINPGSIAHFESGRSLPPLHVLMRLTAEFGVSLNDMVDPSLPKRHKRTLVRRCPPAIERQLTPQQRKRAMDYNGLMTVAQAAQELGVSRQRILVLMKTYGVTAHKTDSQFLIPRTQFERIPKVRVPGRKVNG